jgi:hypothetical protein
MAQRLYLGKETTSFIKKLNFLTWNIESRRSAHVSFGPLLFLLLINDIPKTVECFGNITKDRNRNLTIFKSYAKLTDGM